MRFMYTRSSGVKSGRADFCFNVVTRPANVILRDDPLFCDDAAQRLGVNSNASRINFSPGRIVRSGSISLESGVPVAASTKARCWP